MKTILTTLFCLVAAQASALSCMRPDVATTFLQMNEVPEPVYVLRGTFEFDESLQSQGVVNEPRDPDPIPATFTGHGLTLDGFTSRFLRPVIVQPVCYGSWCGSMAAGEEVITFAKGVGDDIVLEANPCGSTVFYEPTQTMIDDLVSCIRGNRCEPKEF
ncbi:hypothetical protein [Cognatiyoonia sp.]|uniref:hypothetical protein n=1 Tax=Cognatiyoonia sp. TaxID=2211652 RepID=UPI003F6A4CD6